MPHDPESKYRPGPRLLTVADVAVLPEDLPSGPVRYELVKGRLRIGAVADATHGRIQSIIGCTLWELGNKAGHGKAWASVAIIVERNPDTVFVPDAAFALKRPLPIRTSPEDYLESMPDLVVEIRGKGEEISELREKAQEYIRTGARLVWVIDPATKTVTVYSPRENPQTLREGDSLTAKRVILGFKVPVAELFAE
jgi:Uma2 family endonuclease